LNIKPGKLFAKLIRVVVLCSIFPFIMSCEDHFEGIEKRGEIENQHEWGCAVDIQLVGNYAYVATGSTGLKIADISDPSIPVDISPDNEIGGSVWNVVIQGNYAYVPYLSNGLMVVDITNRVNPVEIARLEDIGRIREIAVYGSFLYAAIENDLSIIDISVPENPQLISSLSIPKRIEDIAINGDYAYVATGDSGLRVIDVSSPVNPEEIGIYIPDELTKIAVKDNYLYTASKYEGHRVFDVLDASDPTHIRLVGNCAFGSYSRCNEIEIHNDLAYLAATGGLVIIDIEDPGDPHEIGYYDPAYMTPEALEVSGSFVYVVGTHNDSHYNWGTLIIFDISELLSGGSIFRF